MKKKFTEKSYRLMDDRSGLAFMLKVGKRGDLLTFDEEAGYNRAIRHCPNERSIFVDEQSDHALVAPITFYGGYLEVKAAEQATQIFLNNHPDNGANGGTWFEEVNDEKEAAESIQIDEMKLDIKYAVRQKSKEESGVHELEAVAAVLLNSVELASEMQTEELKRTIYMEVDKDPYYFVDDLGNVNIFDDDSITRKYIVLRAIKDGIIKKTPNSKSIVWARDGALIASAPRGIELVDYFADFLSSDEGMLVAEEIARRS